MKYKIGDYIQIISPDYDDKFIGDVCVVIEIRDIYEYPYRCKYLYNHPYGYDSDMFRDREIRRLNKDEAMVELL